MLVLIIFVALSIVVVKVTIGVVRFVRLDRKGKRHYAIMHFHRIRWRWLCKNSNLAYMDTHKRSVVSVRNFGTKTKVRNSKDEYLRWPKGKFKCDNAGWSVTVKTIPKVGRRELEAASDYIAAQWGVSRVSISVPRPGRVLIRGLRHDPLLVPLTLADMPTRDETCPYLPWLGHDEHGRDRWLDLRNISGICVGGQPGGGKSQCLTSWLTQLSSSPCVQFCLVDGKGANEFAEVGPRAYSSTLDNLDQTLDILESQTKLMYDRLNNIRDITGGLKNIWTATPARPYGVTKDHPCIFSIFDETQTFLDMPAAKAMGKEAERLCAQIIKLSSELVRKGRSAGFVSVFSTQKPTSDSLPSSVAANCAFNAAFSLKTSEGAKATLGPDISDWPMVNPTGLSLPDYVGVCVTSLRDGLTPFTKLRSPLVTETEVAEVASKYAHLRRDPRISPLVTVLGKVKVMSCKGVHCSGCKDGKSMKGVLVVIGLVVVGIMYEPLVSAVHTTTRIMDQTGHVLAEVLKIAVISVLSAVAACVSGALVYASYRIYVAVMDNRPVSRPSSVKVLSMRLRSLSSKPQMAINPPSKVTVNSTIPKQKVIG